MYKAKTTEKIIYTASYNVNYSDTLLEFLLKKCNTSRNNVKALLSHKQVLVNGSIISQFDYPLAKDDVVKISKYPLINEVKKQDKRRNIPKITIIYEDEDFIAIDKPAGLLSVESDNERENTAYNLLQNYLYQTAKVRIYALHRIDKETSGVLVFAKNPKVYSQLKLNWNDYVTTREYYAVVEGKMENKSGTLKNFLAMNKNNLMYISKNNTDKLAITNYEVLKSNNDYSLLRVLIETGRKNQIRVQMNNINHAIVGDEKYGSLTNPLNRLGLHASVLEFRHPFTDKLIKIEANMPHIFKSLF